MSSEESDRRIAALEAELAELRLRERRFRGVAENARGAVYIVDQRSGETIYFNRDELLGYGRAELARPGTFGAMVHPDDQALAGAAWERAAGGERQDVTLRARNKAGGLEWLSQTMVPLHDEAGPTGELLVIVDVFTERRLATEELRRAKERSDLLSAAAGLVVYEYDLGAGSLEWSGEIESVLGYLPAELNGPVERWAALIHPDEYDEAIRQLELAERELRKYEIEYRFRHRDGRYLWLFDRGFFIPGPGGTAARMIGMMQDISARKAAEIERVQLQEQVIEAQQAALRELSTPLIPVSDEVVVLPLVGAMDTARAQMVMEALLEGVADRRAKVAILDITGVSIVDTQVANALVQAARAVSLLGARVVLTGIRPEVAQTLVGLGVDLDGITTRGTLQDGIATVLRA